MTLRESSKWGVNFFVPHLHYVYFVEFFCLAQFPRTCFFALYLYWNYLPWFGLALDCFSKYFMQYLSFVIWCDPSRISLRCPLVQNISWFWTTKFNFAFSRTAEGSKRSWQGERPVISRPIQLLLYPCQRPGSAVIGCAVPLCLGVQSEDSCSRANGGTTQLCPRWVRAYGPGNSTSGIF